jgi:hypothetical protein
VYGQILSVDGATLLSARCRKSPRTENAYIYAECKVEGQPDDDHGSERAGNLCGAERLHEKQKDQNSTGNAGYCRRRDVGLHYLQSCELRLAIEANIFHKGVYLELHQELIAPG